MAFVVKVGSRYQVRQGNNNDVLSTFNTKAEADKEVDRLHKKNKPSSANRGQSAKKDFFSGNKPKKKNGKKKTKKK